MKGKDLTKIAFEDISVGDCTWFPREDNSESHRRGVVIEKGSKTILVIEHNIDYLNDPTIQQTIYLRDKIGLAPLDNYQKITQSKNPKRYDELSKKLKEKGVKL